jgi:hypothetical protein
MTTETKKEELISHEDKKYKTPEYTRRAIKKYTEKRYWEDPDYRKKKNKQSHEYKKKNIEKTREYYRNYMREYRAKKKAEKASIPIYSSIATDDLATAIESLTIKE